MMNELLLKFACPGCGTPLQISQERARCPQDGSEYRCIDGIWRLIAAERLPQFAQFMAEYETIRQAEGRGSHPVDWYRRLPATAPADPFHADWQIRAASFRVLIEQVVVPLEEALTRPLTILDLGAGNGWLSNQLAGRGHQVAAVDLTTNAGDGLGAYTQYETSFLPVQAEFDHLPFVGDQVDLIIYNASLHYATSYETTLSEARRLLRASTASKIVVMDSPIYDQAASGEQMVQERSAAFRQKYGFASDALASQNFLTWSQIERLGQGIGIEWRIVQPWYGWRWRLRPCWAWLRGRRQPAQFALLIGNLCTQTPG